MSQSKRMLWWGFERQVVWERLQHSLYQRELGSSVSHWDVKVGTENPESHWLERQGDRLGVTTAVGK